MVVPNAIKSFFLLMVGIFRGESYHWTTLLIEGFHGPIAVVCAMLNVEMVSHLFLHCPISSLVWNFFFNLLGRAWVMPAAPSRSLSEWNHAHFDDVFPLGRLIWRCVPTVIFWSLWMERNQRIFDDDATAQGRFLNWFFASFSCYVQC